MSLEKYDPNNNMPQKVDPKFAIERVGRQGTGPDSSGTQRQAEQASQHKSALGLMIYMEQVLANSNSKVKYIVFLGLVIMGKLLEIF